MITVMVIMIAKVVFVAVVKVMVIVIACDSGVSGIH